LFSKFLIFSKKIFRLAENLIKTTPQTVFPLQGSTFSSAQENVNLPDPEFGDQSGKRVYNLLACLLASMQIVYRVEDKSIPI
jgi:hypothetical protein